MKSHQVQVVLSAKDYGLLLGVSALSVCHWENDKIKPRPKMLQKFAVVLRMGEREAASILKSLQVRA